MLIEGHINFTDIMRDINILGFYPGRVSASDINAAAQQVTAHQSALDAAQQAAIREAQQAAQRAAVEAEEKKKREAEEKAAAERAAAEERARKEVEERVAQQTGSGNGENQPSGSGKGETQQTLPNGEEMPTFEPVLQQPYGSNFNVMLNGHVHADYLPAKTKKAVSKAKAETVGKYNEAFQKTNEKLDRAIAHPIEGVPTEKIVAAKQRLEERHSVLSSVINGVNNGVKAEKSFSTMLDWIDKTAKVYCTFAEDPPFDLEGYLSDYDKYGKAEYEFDKSLADYLKTYKDVPEPEVREILSDWHPKELDIADYRKTYTNEERLKRVFESDASLKNQITQAGKQGKLAELKVAYKTMSALEKTSPVLTVATTVMNIADSWTEITNAWNDDEKATFAERLQHFGDIVKAQNHEKYDNLNTGLIDLGEGIAAVGVGLMATPGVATTLAITVGFLFVNAAAKTYYYAYQHENVDLWKTFGKNLNPMDGGYATKQSEPVAGNGGETKVVEILDITDTPKINPLDFNPSNITTRGGKKTAVLEPSFLTENKADVNIDEPTDGKETAVLEPPPFLTETKVGVKIDEPANGKELAVLEPPLLTETKADVITTRGGKSNDVLLNSDFSNVVLMGEDADDLIVNQGSENVSTFGGTGNDTVTNVTSSNVKIYGEEGNDFINNSADTVEIFAGTGDNTIKNFGSAEVSIIAAQGNDFIENISDGTLIDAGDGKNLVENIGAEVSIKTGSDSDDIHSHGVKVQIDSGEGDDSIESEGDEVTIKAGAGDNAKGHKFIDSCGNLNDISLAGETGYVKSVGDANTIKANTRTGLIEVVGNETEIIGNKGNIAVFVYGGLYNSVSGSAESDVVYNSSDESFIDMSAGDDSVTNHGQHVVIVTGAGDNFVKNTRYTSWNYTMHKWMTTGTSPDDVIIAGAADADTIYNYGG